MRKLPTRLKALRGTLRRDRENPNEAQPEAGLPNAPAFLNEVAKREWKRLGAELVKLRLVSKLDSALFAAYCANYATWVEAEERLELEGLTTQTKLGAETPSCWWTISKQATEQMLKIGCEFGLTPVSRSRVTPIPAPTPENALAQFLKPASVTPIWSDDRSDNESA